MREEDIRYWASKLAEGYGPRAAAYAERRIADMEAQGNKDGAEGWRQIRAAIQALQQPESG